MMRTVVETVEMTANGREATPEDLVGQVAPGYFCGAKIDAVGALPNFQWTCTRSAEERHFLHIAISGQISGQHVFCASWSERVVIEEDPEWNDET